jgi:dolichol-phosphate mannosyltransferase
VKLSVVIPAHNEEACIATTVSALYRQLTTEHIDHEIVVVNDNSSDSTDQILRDLRHSIPSLTYVENAPPPGFGFAVRKGLEHYHGDAVAIYMADASDRPEDLVKFHRVMETTEVDCVFGTRFSRESQVIDYPWFKFLLNRCANTLIQLLFGLRYNDVTNAFKLYKRHVIDGLKPLLSHHFNLTVELPLKSIVRGYSYTVVPNDWINRKAGVSKLLINEMGSRYLFIVLYCFIEKWLSKKDYHREKRAAERRFLRSHPAVMRNSARGSGGKPADHGISEPQPTLEKSESVAASKSTSTPSSRQV